MVIRGIAGRRSKIKIFLLNLSIFTAIMAVSSGMSFLLSTTLSVLLFAGMQMYRQQLASKEYLTILGGFLGSNLFIFVLTAVGNLESTLFGRGFQTKFFPEVISCLLIALFASGLVHRVCVTTCFIFSIIALYFINNISQATYAVPVTAAPERTKSGKKNEFSAGH